MAVLRSSLAPFVIVCLCLRLLAPHLGISAHTKVQSVPHERRPVLRFRGTRTCTILGVSLTREAEIENESFLRAPAWDIPRSPNRPIGWCHYEILDRPRSPPRSSWISHCLRWYSKQDGVSQSFRTEHVGTQCSSSSGTSGTVNARPPVAHHAKTRSPRFTSSRSVTANPCTLL
jgi:hypothetical protein